MACGALHTLALTSEGRVLGCGHGDSYALGVLADKGSEVEGYLTTSRFRVIEGLPYSEQSD